MPGWRLPSPYTQSFTSSTWSTLATSSTAMRSQYWRREDLTPSGRKISNTLWAFIFFIYKQGGGEESQPDLAWKWNNLLQEGQVLVFWEGDVSWTAHRHGHYNQCAGGGVSRVCTGRLPHGLGHLRHVVHHWGEGSNSIETANLINFRPGYL